MTQTARPTVLSVTRGLFHPSLFARFRYEQVLGRYATVVRLPRLERVSPEAVATADVVSVYLHRNTIQENSLRLLEEFVHAGGGLIVIHSGSASFKAEPRWEKLIGGRFVSHGPITTFEVRPAEGTLPPFAGIPPFRVRDELYRHRFGNDLTIQLETTADGQTEPVAWTRTYGRGRIFYLCLGHRAAVFKDRDVRRIIGAAVTWTTGETP